MGKSETLEEQIVVPQRVLVVEDDAILALSIEEQLTEIGVEDIVICSTAADALAALREKKPDAMILDVHLADRSDGWTLAELADSIGPKPPRVIYSTGSPDDIPEEAKQLGQVLEKPFDVGELGKLLITTRQKRGLLRRLRRVLK